MCLYVLFPSRHVKCYLCYVKRKIKWNFSKFISLIFDFKLYRHTPKNFGLRRVRKTEIGKLTKEVERVRNGSREENQKNNVFSCPTKKPKTRIAVKLLI